VQALIWHSVPSRLGTVTMLGGAALR